MVGDGAATKNDGLRGETARTAAAFARMDAAGIKPTAEQITARGNFAENLRRAGRTAEAEAHQRRVLAWAPDFGGAHYNMGVLLSETGRPAAAADAFAEAERLMPDFPAAAVNLSAALRACGDPFAAAAAARRALSKGMAAHPAAWANLAAALLDQEKRDEAAAALVRALALAPQMGEGWVNLAAALKDAGRDARVVDALRRALTCGLSDSGGALAQLSQALRRLCRWDALAEVSARLRTMAAAGSSRRIHPWIFLNEGAGRAAERDAARRYVAGRVAGLRPLPPPHRVPPPASGRFGERLRIGYLSSDFQEHATALLLVETLEKHDRSRVEAFLYSYGPDDAGPMRRRIAAAADRFVDVRALSHTAAAERIRADGVDVLVDLKGHTQGARPAIAALRPAPVQAQWLGYPGTMGAPFIDFIIADAEVAPPEHQADYDERVVRLPGSCQPNDGGRRIDSTTPERAELGLPDDAFVFCGFNAAYKLNSAVFDVWCGLLRAVPEAVLWLLEPEAEAAANLRREADKRGVAGERLIFAPRRPQSAYLAQYRRADLFLDAWPVGAHTTAGDALWAGLPVLTWAGPTFAGRVAAGLLRALGLPELIAASPDDYAERALRLVGDRPALASIRDRLATARTASGVFDGGAFARKLEDAFFEMRRAGTVNGAGDEGAGTEAV